MIAIINAHMLGMTSEPGEPDWDAPDVMSEEAWTALFDVSIENYAAANPHMIVWEVA